MNLVDFSVPTTSILTSSNQSELAQINNATRRDTVFPTNKEVIVPVDCSCSGQYYQANTTYKIADDQETYFLIANETFQGLTNCDALMWANPYSQFDLQTGLELQVPLRCACPTKNQTAKGTKYLLTYSPHWDDNIPAIGDKFNVSAKSILSANEFSQEDPILLPFTTILIPLPTEPLSSQTIVRNDSCRFTSTYLYFDQAVKVFEFEEINKATENFSSKSRIKGSVYRGMFSSKILAVKKMGTDVSKEVNMLNKFNHFNLIKLHGVCENQGCFYLVFEYMENGSLREWLCNRGSRKTQSWAWRIQIALDVANGLHYLHSFTEPAYVHKDIKSSNVLLNSDLRAKIANFSLARTAERGTNSAALTTRVVGTRGYMAPEYIEEGLVTPMVDVYAFGVIMLELITGKDAVIVEGGGEILLSAAFISIMEGEKAEAELISFVDPNLKGNNGVEFALRVAKLSTACLTRDPASRPSMGDVVSSLSKIQANLQKLESSSVEFA
ncbi:hypothetical protein L1049_026420 [Liquidambar formosana]|uniref:Protein kinase domain-containing protein n=1 Tax=Liquidambar formosana TaxID=63359 RepID=A0AAP0NGC8_LIQFO